MLITLTFLKHPDALAGKKGWEAIPLEEMSKDKARNQEVDLELGQGSCSLEIPSDGIVQAASQLGRNAIKDLSPEAMEKLKDSAQKFHDLHLAKSRVKDVQGKSSQQKIKEIENEMVEAAREIIFLVRDNQTQPQGDLWEEISLEVSQSSGSSGGRNPWYRRGLMGTALGAAGAACYAAYSVLPPGYFYTMLGTGFKVAAWNLSAGMKFDQYSWSRDLSPVQIQTIKTAIGWSLALPEYVLAYLGLTSAQEANTNIFVMRAVAFFVDSLATNLCTQFWLGEPTNWSTWVGLALLGGAAAIQAGFPPHAQIRE